MKQMIFSITLRSQFFFNTIQIYMGLNGTSIKIFVHRKYHKMLLNFMYPVLYPLKCLRRHHLLFTKSVQYLSVSVSKRQTQNIQQEFYNFQSIAYLQKGVCNIIIIILNYLAQAQLKTFVASKIFLTSTLPIYILITCLQHFYCILTTLCYVLLHYLSQLLQIDEYFCQRITVFLNRSVEQHFPDHFNLPSPMFLIYQIQQRSISLKILLKFSKESLFEGAKQYWIFFKYCPV